MEIADQTCSLTQSQYAVTGLTSSSADPIMPGIWQGGHRSTNFKVTGMTRLRENITGKAEVEPWPAAVKVDALPLGQCDSHDFQAFNLTYLHLSASACTPAVVFRSLTGISSSKRKHSILDLNRIFLKLHKY